MELSAQAQCKYELSLHGGNWLQIQINSISVTDDGPDYVKALVCATEIQFKKDTVPGVREK